MNDRPCCTYPLLVGAVWTSTCHKTEHYGKSLAEVRRQERRAS